MKKVTKVGVVGCGNICKYTYLPNIIDHFKNLEIYALCDLDTNKARDLGKEFGISRIMTLEEMCADANVEIILNTTTPQSHYPINIRALAARKHVYCEKPLGLKYEEAFRTIKMADENHLYVGCAPDVILGAGIQTARKAIDDRLIGEPIGTIGANMYHGPEFLHNNPDFLYKTGAGPMLDIGPYTLSIILYLMGPVTEICCYGGMSFPQRFTRNPSEHFIDVEINTYYSGIMKFQNSQSATINFSWDTYCAEYGPMVRIFGTKGTLHIKDSDCYNDGTGVKLMVEKDLLGTDGKLEKDKVLNSDRYLRPMSMLFDSPKENRGIGLSEMADAILHGRKSLLSGDFACHMTELLDGFNVAIETGKPYKMKSTFATPGRLPEDYLNYAKHYAD